MTEPLSLRKNYSVINQRSEMFRRLFSTTILVAVAALILTAAASAATWLSFCPPNQTGIAVWQVGVGKFTWAATSRNSKGVYSVPWTAPFVCPSRNGNTSCQVTTHNTPPPGYGLESVRFSGTNYAIWLWGYCHSNNIVDGDDPEYDPLAPPAELDPDLQDLEIDAP